MYKEKEQHESYGMAGFYRIQCSAAHPLFGSSIKHRDTIILRIKTAKMERNLHKNWYYGDKEIVEIEMSKSQFADLITSLNQGDGVPVTIKSIHGKDVEPCPFKDVGEMHLQEFKNSNKETLDTITGLINHLKNLFATKKNLTKADREECISTLTKIYNGVKPNAEYQLEAFQEQMAQTTTEAKGEIEAFFENKIMSASQNALVENADEVKKLTTQNPVEI